MIQVYQGKQRGLGEEPTSQGYIKLSFRFREVIHHFKGAQLAVFMAILLHADEDGLSYPGYDRLQKETGYGRDTIANALAELCNLSIDGHPVLCRWRERDEKGQYTGSNRYLIFPSSEELQSPKKPTLENANVGFSSLEEEPVVKEEPEEEEEAPPALTDKEKIFGRIKQAYERWIGSFPMVVPQSMQADIDKYPADRICEALEITQQRHIEGRCSRPSWNYAMGIVRGWETSGYDGTRGAPAQGNWLAELEAWL